MAQVLFATDTTCANADLDANHNELYRIRELISTPAFASYAAYTASNEKGAIDATTFSFNWKIGDIKNSGTGNIVVTGSGKLGYDTGSGGSVTQLTSKSTLVTLNKRTGTVITAADSLGAGASVAFVLANSTLGTNDVVVCHAASNGNYEVRCITSQSGSATIRITNITGGSLAEALTIKFLTFCIAVS